MSRRIALADQLYGGNVESTVLAPLCPNMVIWLKILKLTWFKLLPSPKKMRHINIDLSMKSNHFLQEMVHKGPFSDTRSPTNIIIYKTIIRSLCQQCCHVNENTSLIFPAPARLKAVGRVQASTLMVCFSI